MSKIPIRLPRSIEIFRPFLAIFDNFCLIFSGCSLSELSTVHSLLEKFISIIDELGEKKQEKNSPLLLHIFPPLEKISSHGMKNLLIPDDNKFVPIADKKKILFSKTISKCETQTQCYSNVYKNFPPTNNKNLQKLLFSKNKIVQLKNL